MWDFLGGLVGAGASIFNASANRKQQEEFNRQQIAMSREQMAMQKEFAQQGIKWKVDDAVRAGLHPLIGAGAQAQSFSPVSVGGSAPQMADFGQDIGRAVKAAGSLFERENEDEKKLKNLAMEKAGLENDILKADLVSRVRREAQQLGPAFPGSADHVDIRSGGIPLPRPGPARMSSGEAVREDDLKQTIEDQPSPESGRPYGFQMPYNRMFGSAQAFEDRYGDSEIAQTLKFLINSGADISTFLYNTFPGRTGSAARRRRASRPWGE